MMPERSISVLIVCILLIPALSVGVEIPKDLQVITEDYAPMNLCRERIAERNFCRSDGRDTAADG